MLQVAKAALLKRYWDGDVSVADYSCVLETLYTLDADGAAAAYLQACAQADAAKALGVLTAWREGAPIEWGIAWHDRLVEAKADPPGRKKTLAHPASAGCGPVSCT